MFLSQAIAQAGAKLTPTERVIAEAVLDDPSLLAFGTVSDLAQRVGTSRPSIVRFATKLGFDGYGALQDQVRSEVSRQLGRPSERIRRDRAVASADTGRGRSELESAFGRAFEALGEGRLGRMATPLAKAERIWIVTGETSRAGAQALHSGLSMVRPGVHLLEVHTSARDLASAGPKDCGVAIDFERYRQHTLAIAKALREQGLPLVAITDGPLSPLAALTDTWCELEIPAVGPFDSSLPAILVVEQLVAEVAHLRKGKARDRVDRIESAWGELGTFEALDNP